MKGGIKALKIGNRADEILKKQSYILRVHSVFSHAVNFINLEDYLVTVLERKNGASSQSITIETQDMDNLLCYKLIPGNCIDIKNLICFEAATKVHFGTPPRLNSLSFDLIACNVWICREYMTKNVCLSGVTASIFGQDNIYKNYTNNTLKALECGYNKGDMEEITKALQALIGLGQGLTPSGDDFICGFTSALYFCSEASGLNKNWTRSIGERVLEGAAVRTTTVSYNMLRSYLGGELSEHIQDFLKSMAVLNEKSLLYSFKKVLQMGSTSGADMAAGVLFGLKLAVKAQRERLGGIK